MGQSDVYMYLYLFSISVFYSFLHLWYVALVQQMLSWNNFKINSGFDPPIPLKQRRGQKKKKGGGLVVNSAM